MDTLALNKLKTILKTKAKIDINTDDITDNTDLIEDLGIDSVKMLDLIIDIEDNFEIELDDDTLDLNKIRVFKGLVDTISGELK